MFEGLRDRRPNRRPEAEESAQPTAASILARRQMRRAGGAEPAAPDGTVGKAGVAVAGQLAMVAKHAAAQQRAGHDGHKARDGQGKGEEQGMTEAGQTLTVGAGIQLKGEITNCHTLVVEGHVEGSAKSRSLQISDGGAFVGDAEINTVAVSGRFEGNLIATQRLIIRGTGRVSGTIRYAAIAIEAGGQISGDIQVTEATTALGEAPVARIPEDGPAERVEIAS